MHDFKDLSLSDQIRLLDAIKQQVRQKIRDTSAGPKCEKCSWYTTIVCQGCAKPDPSDVYSLNALTDILCRQCHSDAILPQEGFVALANSSQLKCDCE